MASFDAELAAVKKMWPHADTTKIRIIAVPGHSWVIPDPAVAKFDLNAWLNEEPLEISPYLKTIKIDIQCYQDANNPYAPLYFGYNPEYNILAVKVRKCKPSASRKAAEYEGNWPAS